MKKLFILLACTALMFSCTEDETEIETVTPEVPSVTPEVETPTSLEDFSSENIPEEDTWVVDATTATADEFEGLVEAIVAASEQGREISLEFPYLKEIPSYALYFESDASAMDEDSEQIIEGELTRSTTSSSATIVSVSAPEATSIGDYALYGCESLTSVDFPEVVTVGEAAFRGCSALESIELPKATYVGISAFYLCTALESVELAKITSIENHTFFYCTALESVETPLATSIGTYVFSNCYALESIELPEVTAVGEGAFSSCKALSSIDMPLATSIGMYAFQSCTALESIELPKATSFEHSAFGSCTGLTSLSIATDSDVKIESITSSAFDNVDTEAISLYLSSANEEYVNGPVLTVGSFSATFKEILIDGVVAEKSWTLADLSATSYPDEDIWVIEDATASTTDFAGFSAAIEALATSGRKISVEFPNLDAIPAYAIFGKEESQDTSTAMALVSVSAPKVTSIGDYAFYGCSALESVDMPEVTTIGNNTFYSCSTLETVDLPEATSIGDRAFLNCSALESIELPEATSIGSYAFFDCTALESIELPKATSIGEKAFGDCSALTSLSIATDSGVKLESIASDAFDNTDTEAISLYLSSANEEYVNGNILTIGDLSATFKEIFIDGVVAEITDWTLAILSATSYPDEDTWVIEDATASTTDFAGFSAAISSLATSGRKISVEFPNLDAIPDYAIFGKTGTSTSYESGALASVSAPEATSIGDYAFYNCTALESIELPEATSIGYYAFYGSALKSIELPQVTSIGDSAFIECTALKSIELPQVTSIGSSAFRECTALESIDLPKVTTIEYYAFRGCTALTSLSLATDSGVKLESISSDALYIIDTELVSFYTSSANEEYVDVNVLTVGSFSATFKEIFIDGVLVEEEIVYDNAWDIEDFSATNYPADDTWVISNTSIHDMFLSGFRAAIAALNGSGRRIALELPYLTDEITSYMTVDRDLFVEFEYTSDVIESVYAPKATSVGNNAFYGSTSLVSVDLPKATEIEQFAFQGCTSLESISLPSVTETDYGVFWMCTALKSADLPAVETLGIYTFKYCSSLES